MVTSKSLLAAEINVLVDLSASAMTEWYTEDEIDCIRDTKLPPFSTYTRCHSERLPMFENCPTPFYNRSSWWKGPKHLIDVPLVFIQSVFNKLLERNVTLLFIGDSLSSQRVRFMSQDIARSSGFEWTYTIVDKPEKPVEMGNNIISYLKNTKKGLSTGRCHHHL